MQRSKQGTRKGYHLLIQGIRKGYLFRKKNGIWKGKGLDLRVEPLRINICWVPPRSSVAYFFHNFVTCYKMTLHAQF